MSEWSELYSSSSSFSSSKVFACRVEMCAQHFPLVVGQFAHSHNTQIENEDDDEDEYN